MKTIKINKKVSKPVFKVDITWCSTEEDVLVAIADAKLDANVALTKEQFEAVIADEVRFALHVILNTAFTWNNAIVWENDGFRKMNLNKYHIENDEKFEITKNGVKIKKQNIFKRFWNWITRKK